MGGLRDIESTLPPGFRFYPSDQELVCHYLYKKVIHHQSRQSNFTTMVEVDLHTVEPWELPDEARSSGNEWYFFNFRDRKYATGCRSNRATEKGYWKATGKDRMMYDETGGRHEMVVVGMRKTLVFYIGRAPNGMKTSWVMHEFRLHNPHMPAKEDWVLCRVFDKTKRETNDARYYGLMEGSNGGVEEQLDYYCNIINRNPVINTGASSFPLVDPYLQPQCMSINNDNSDYRYDDDDDDDDNHQWYDSYFTATTSSKNNADIYESNSLFECGDELFGVKPLDLAADHQNAGLTTQQMIE